VPWIGVALWTLTREARCEVDAGLSEKDAMEISGHKTPAIFDRYTIVNDRRMKQNVQKSA
jgi:hypothetical protein